MSYETFAYYYDSLMDPQFYDDYFSFIIQHCQFEEALELGCGTGEMAIRLSKQGKKIFATDISKDMLEVAKQKAMHENVDLMLQRVDMCDFSTSYPIDLILCLCDSINYLLDSKDVIKTFQNVYQSLKKGGTFLFDIDSLYKMNIILNEYKEDEDDDEFCFQWHVSHLDDGYVHHHIYIHDKIMNEIVEEDHYQKTYSVEQYVSWLKQVGFSKVSYYSDFQDYYENCERIIFVCRKE